MHFIIINMHIMRINIIGNNYIKLLHIYDI